MIIIAGNSHKTLAQQISNALGCEYIQASSKKFADQELKVQITHNLYNKEVVLLQSTTKPANDNLMELLLLADTVKRAGCKNITAVIPYFGYSRQDKPSYEYGPISASLVARLIETSGISKVITIDMHSKQSEGFFQIEVRNIDPIDIFIPALQTNKNYVVISPDVGGLPRARMLANKLTTDLAIINKTRNFDGKCVMSEVIGNVEGRNCIIIDDIVDTGETLCKAVQLLLKKGAKSVSAFITHAVLSHDSIQKISQAGFKKFLITDTIYHQELPSFIQIIPTASLIAKALLNNN